MKYQLVYKNYNKDKFKNSITKNEIVRYYKYKKLIKLWLKIAKIKGDLFLKMMKEEKVYIPKNETNNIYKDFLPKSYKIWTTFEKKYNNKIKFYHIDDVSIT